MKDKLTMLMILDGFGSNLNEAGNAVELAKTPNIDELMKKFEDIKTLQELNDLKVMYQGKKGIITELNAGIKEVPNEEKKEYGAPTLK